MTHVWNANEVGVGDVDWEVPEECYKVVCRDGDELKSSNASFPEMLNEVMAELVVHYAQYERAVPKVGKLFVFDTYRHASMFVDLGIRGSFREIWLAHGENLKPLNIVLQSFRSSKIVPDFWNMIETEVFNPQLVFPVVNAPPMGTLMSDSVTLIKRVR